MVDPEPPDPKDLASLTEASDDAVSAQVTFSLLHAPRANLDARARGDCADRLVTSLVNDLTAWETASGQRKNIRHKGLEKLTAMSSLADKTTH